jgi:type I restriction enzyme, S subunit
MELKTFFDNFELLTDAPNGVQKLREMILQLAVQGKLVPQDPRDEPEALLLKKIKAEKERLIKEGKIKKQKEITEIIEDEKLFSLPNAWGWARLQTLVSVLGDGLHGTPNYTPGTSYYFVNGNNLNNGKIEIKPSTKTVSFEEMIKYKKDLSSNAILVSINGTLGNVAFYNGEKIILGKSACYFNLSEHVSKHFMKIVLESPYFMSYAFRNATGSTIKNLPLKAMNNLPVPLPSHAEQKRIVAKVDELMALCDELEARKQKVATTCIRLNDASLDGLVAATEPNKFNKNWQRICDSFDILYSRPENVVKLRQAILQLAVQGKLVPQDPKDEPVSVLLEKIKAEKERLIKGGKIRMVEPSPVIKEDEIPYLLPVGWEWVRLGMIGFTQTGTTPSKANPVYFGNFIPFIKPGDISDNGINYDNEGLSKKGSENGRLIDSHSILMVCIGGSIGKVNFIDRHCSCNQQINTITPYCDIPHKLMNYFMRSTFFQAEVIKRASKTTLPIISKGKWELIPVPLPPVNEQKRIVAKVDELMGFCDRLEAGLGKSQKDCNRLMDAAVAEIMAA